MRVTLIDLWGREAMLHYASQLANSLAVLPDVHVTVLLPEGSDKSLFLETVEVEYLDVVMGASIKDLLSVPLKLAKLPWFFRTITRTRPDVLHLNNCHVWYIFTLPWLRKQYPIVSTMHDVEPHPGLDDSWRKHKEIDTLARLSHQIFLHGERLKQELLEKYRALSPGQIHVIPLGELSFFSQYPSHADEDPNTVLFFGRVRAYKGLEYFISAAELVAQEVPNSRFIIAGDGDLRPYQEILKKADNFEIHNSYIPDHQVSTLFNRASMVVLPYTQASQSAVIPVAYAFKKPVVTTDVGCLVDVVEHGRTGLVVPPGNAPALAEAILKLLCNPELRLSLGRRGYQEMKEKLGWEQIVAKTVEVYNIAIDEFK